MKKAYLWKPIIYVIVGMTAFVSYERGNNVWAAGLLMIEALFIYGIEIHESGSVISLKGILGLSWIGGMGLSCLQLSNLQKIWKWKTWLCFLLIYPAFVLAYELWWKRMQRPHGKEKRPDAGDGKEKQANILLGSIVGTTILSLLGFIAEAIILQYVPLFADTGHAYLEFHVSGIHYFTIQCVMIPALSVLYFRRKNGEKCNRTQKILLVFSNLTAVLIPVLCVSRFHFLYMTVLAVVVYMSAYGKGTWRTVVMVVAVVIPVYVLLSVARNQSAGYLEGVFAMKNTDIPVWIAQPYMYVASNYENFNYMVESMASHLYDGVRMLYPLWALTGLKFLFPVEISRPPYIVKKELSTFTLFYDAYYDFGIIGLLVFASALGMVSAFLTKRMAEGENPVIHLFYGQVAICFMLSFFTTWFSDPTVWFRLIMTSVIYMIIEKDTKQSEEKEGEKRWKTRRKRG